MSPPPSGEPALPLEPQRPKALAAVSIIGIVLGSLGVLCVCMGLANLLISSQQQQMMSHASMRDVIIQMSTSVAGVLISMFLLIACIGTLNLRPWSATMMVVINVINLIFETFKLVLGIVYGIPKTLETMQHLPADAPQQQVQAMQNAQAYMGYIKVGIYVVTVLLFLVQATYSIVTLLVMRRADVKKALSNPMDPPQTPMM